MFYSFYYFNNPKRIRSFICTAAYFRHEIPNFKLISKPLITLMHKPPQQFHWSEYHHQLYLYIHTHLLTFLTRSFQNRRSG